MFNLIQSPALHIHLAKGHPGAQYRDPYLHFTARRSLGEGGCTRKISEDDRTCTAEQGIAEEEALAKGMKEKSCEFFEKGAEVYSLAY